MPPPAQARQATTNLGSHRCTSIPEAKKKITPSGSQMESASARTRRISIWRSIMPAGRAVAAQHRGRPGALQFLCRARWQGVGPLGAGAGAGNNGEPRDRRDASEAPRLTDLSGSRNRYVMWTPSLCSSDDLSTPGRVPENSKTGLVVRRRNEHRPEVARDVRGQ